MSELMEESGRIAGADLPLEERLAQLKELQASCRGHLGDIPRLYILDLEKELAKGK